MALSLLLLFGARFPAFAFDFNGSWEYRISGGEDTDTQETFSQRYNLNTGFTLEPTHAISASANVGYSSYIRDQDSGRQTNEVLTPSAELWLRNDIFRAGLDGNVSQTRQSSGSNLDTYVWQATLGSGWRQELWPDLTLHYSESGSTAEDPRRETWGSDAGLDVNWDLRVGKLFYGYAKRRSEDRTAQSQTDDSSHYARFDTAGRFWDNRGSFSFSQAVNHSSAEFSAVVPAEGVVSQEQDVQTLSIQDPGPEVHPDLTLNPEPGLRDPETVTISITPGQIWHLGVLGAIFSGGEQRVNQLRVLVEPDDPIEGVTVQDDLRWDLYASRDNAYWETVAEDVDARYNIADQRFEIDVPPLQDSAYRYLKVVVTYRRVGGAEDVPVKVRALQAVRLITGPPGSRISESTVQTTYTTDLNLAMQLSSTVRASSTLHLDYGGESTLRDVSGRLGWTPSPLVAPSLGFSESRREFADTPTQIDRSYTLNIPVFPLPSLYVSFGATHRDNYDGSRKTLTQDNFTVTSTAVLYPDLTADGTGTYSVGRTVDASDTATDRRTATGALGLHARISPKLKADLTNQYLRTFEPTPSTALDSTLDLNYRPSNYLVMDLLVTRDWTGESEDLLDFNLNLALLRTDKTRVNFTYEHREDGNSFDSFGLLGSWDLSRVFTLKCQSNYTAAERDSWTVTSSLFLTL